MVSKFFTIRIKALGEQPDIVEDMSALIVRKELEGFLFCLSFDLITYEKTRTQVLFDVFFHDKSVSL